MEAKGVGKSGMERPLSPGKWEECEHNGEDGRGDEEVEEEAEMVEGVEGAE